MPADLSIHASENAYWPDEWYMANQGFKKHVIAEADFIYGYTGNEMYAYLNVNQLRTNYPGLHNNGWQPVLMWCGRVSFLYQQAKCRSLHFQWTEHAGETITADKNGEATIQIEVDWTFPLHFAEIIDGECIPEKDQPWIIPFAFETKVWTYREHKQRQSGCSRSMTQLLTAHSPKAGMD